jgi:hypothetical protein
MCPLVRLQRLASERQVAGPHYLAVAAAAEGDGRKKNKQNDANSLSISSPSSSTQAGSQSHLRICLPGYSVVAKAKVI